MIKQHISYIVEYSIKGQTTKNLFVSCSVNRTPIFGKLTKSEAQQLCEGDLRNWHEYIHGEIQVEKISPMTMWFTIFWFIKIQI